MGYPVDIKTVNITTATTTTIFNGPARILGLSWVVPTNVAAGTITVRILGLSWVVPTNVAAGTITVNDNTTAMWVVNTPATNTTDYKSPVTGKIMLPGTGIRANTSLKVTNVAVTHVTVYYG